MAGEQWALDWAFERCDDGAPMICTGCGSTRSLEYIYTLGPKVMSCCPERKMVSVTARIAELEAEVARKDEALEYYANGIGFSEIEDGGAVARIALKAPGHD